MSAPLRGHQRLDQRSLALHRAIAGKLRSPPALIEIAHDNLERWSRTAGRSQPYWDEWRKILAGDTLCGRAGAGRTLGHLFAI